MSEKSSPDNIAAESKEHEQTEQHQNKMDEVLTDDETDIFEKPQNCKLIENAGVVKTKEQTEEDEDSVVSIDRQCCLCILLATAYKQ